MDSELKAYLTLQDLGLSVADGDTAVDTVLQLARDADRVLRPYRYEQAEGMRTAFALWWRHWPHRAHYECVSADVLNIFQAGYTARGER